jgi:hypothetical protein
MLQVPPPFVHLFRSGSRTHEKEEVMRSPLRSVGVFVGGEQVATVNISMNFKMKNLGNVPPRLDTLFCVN